MITALTQPLLCAVLQYRHHGNFAEFKQASDLALGAVASGDRYFYSNLLLAAQIAGLLEMSLEKGTIHWWVAFEGDIRVRSVRPKSIGTSGDWFNQPHCDYRPLITNSRGEAFILGCDERASTPDETRSPGIFETPLTSRLMPYAMLERCVCTQEPISIELDRSEERFDVRRGEWIPVDDAENPDLQLFRARQRYSGLCYYLQSQKLRVRLRITQPEWAFVVAYNVLRWSLDDLLVIRDQTITLRRAVRLPALILRFLFAAAHTVVIGPEVRFLGMDPAAIENIRAYFSKAYVTT
jgi:hypothetical protein